MSVDENTLDILDIPTDGSFIALGQQLQWNDVPGAVLFDIQPKEGEEPTLLLLRFLSSNGKVLPSYIDRKNSNPFFTVALLNSSLEIIVIPEAWLSDALKIPVFYDAFCDHPYLKQILLVQSFFLRIKKLAPNDIVLGFYMDKLQQFKGCFFDSFADFFNHGYYSNMIQFAFSQMAYENTLLQTYGMEPVLQKLIEYTPLELLSLPVERLKKTFISIASIKSD